MVQKYKTFILGTKFFFTHKNLMIKQLISKRYYSKLSFDIQFANLCIYLLFQKKIVKIKLFLGDFDGKTKKKRKSNSQE